MVETTFPNNYDDKSTGTDPKAPIMIGMTDTFFGLYILEISSFNSTYLVSFSTVLEESLESPGIATSMRYTESDLLSTNVRSEQLWWIHASVTIVKSHISLQFSISKALQDECFHQDS